MSDQEDSAEEVTYRTARLLIQLDGTEVSNQIGESFLMGVRDVQELPLDHPNRDGAGAQRQMSVDLLELATGLERAAADMRRRWRQDPKTEPVGKQYPSPERCDAYDTIEIEEVLHAHVRTLVPMGNLPQWAGIHLAPGERIRMIRPMVLELTGAPNDPPV